MALLADLEELLCLSLDTLCRVQHHYGTVYCHKGTVGIFGKVLMARSIKNIYPASAVIKLQN